MAQLLSRSDLRTVEEIRQWQNERYRYRMQTDDEFYFGLGERIKQRQNDKIPEAGAGTVEFLSILGNVTKGVSLIFPPFRKVTLAIEGVKDLVESRLEE